MKNKMLCLLMLSMLVCYVISVDVDEVRKQKIKCQLLDLEKPHKTCKRTYTSDVQSLVNFLKKDLDDALKVNYVKNVQQCGNGDERRKRALDAVKEEYSTLFATIKELQCFKPDDVDITLNLYKMCSECIYEITLVENYSQRRIIHKTCDHGDGTKHCLYGEGSCNEIKHVITLYYNSAGVFDPSKPLSSYTEVPLTLTTGCACQVVKGNVLESLVA